MNLNKKALNASKKGEELLKIGFPNEAMTHFWYSANEFESSHHFAEAAQMYVRSAYCYELDDLFEKAINDLEKAKSIYDKTNDIDNSNLMTLKIVNLRSLNNKARIGNSKV